jgi:hypothetical protein
MVTAAQPHPERTADQVRRLGGPDPLLALLGGGQQHRHDLVLGVAPERPRIPCQQPPVPALQPVLPVHAMPPASPGSSRRGAAAALARSRTASSASTVVPVGVSR